jgi:hypothetical protein
VRNSEAVATLAVIRNITLTLCTFNRTFLKRQLNTGAKYHRRSAKLHFTINLSRDDAQHEDARFFCFFLLSLSLLQKLRLVWLLWDLSPLSENEN